MSAEPGPTRDPNSYIGGSSIAAVIRLGYESPLSLWARLTGRVPPKPTGDAATAGQVLERPILERLYAPREGVGLSYPGTQPLPAPYAAWWAAHTPDAVANDQGTGELLRLVECKLVGPYQAFRWGRPDEGADGIPAEVYCQVVWNCGGQQLGAADVVGAFGAQVHTYRVPHDGELFEHLWEAAARFVRDYVDADKMPPPGPTKQDEELLQRFFPQASNPLQTDTTGKIERLARRYDELRQQVSDLEAQQQEVKNQLIAAIGDAEGYQGKWGKVTYRQKKQGPRWKYVAKALGASDELAEQYRPEPTRSLSVNVKGE